MHTHGLAYRLASIAAGSIVIFGSATASAYNHLDAALEFLANTQSNDLASSSEPCTIDWDTYTGKLKAACFFTLCVQHAYGYSDTDIHTMWGSTSPPSGTLDPEKTSYFEIVDNSVALGAPDPEAHLETYFRRISRAVDIDAGDIIVINATTTYSGHLMIVAGEPSVLTGYGPTFSGTTQWVVPVLDATSSAHNGCKSGVTTHPDTRFIGTCAAPATDPGAGTGYLRVYTDNVSGQLLGHTWSTTHTTNVSSYLSPTTRPYRVGRLANLPAPLPPPEEPPPPPP